MRYQLTTAFNNTAPLQIFFKGMFALLLAWIWYIWCLVTIKFGLNAILPLIQIFIVGFLKIVIFRVGCHKEMGEGWGGDSPVLLLQKETWSADHPAPLFYIYCTFAMPPISIFTPYCTFTICIRVIYNTCLNNPYAPLGDLGTLPAVSDVTALLGGFWLQQEFWSENGKLQTECWSKHSKISRLVFVVGF